MSRHNALVNEFRELASALAGDAATYLEQFIATSAWSAIAVLEAAERGDRVEPVLAEAEEQGRVVLETLVEMKDQAARRALLRGFMATTRLLALAAAP